MAYLSAIYIPAFEFHFNLVVYPLPAEERNVSNLKKVLSILKSIVSGSELLLSAEEQCCQAYCNRRDALAGVLARPYLLLPAIL